MSNNSIQVFKKRDFGELISTPITFLIREFKKLFITLLVFVGPLIVLNLILARSLGNAYIQDVWSTIRYGASGNPLEFYNFEMFLMQLIGFFETIVMYTVLAVYVKLYKIHGSDGFELQDIWNEFAKRIGHTTLAMFVASIVLVFGFIVFVIPGIYLAVVFYVFCAVIVFEELPFGEAFSRVFQVMKGNWWMTFGTFIIMAIVAGIVNLIISGILTAIFRAFGFGSTILIISSVVTGLVSLIITSVIGLLPVFIYTSFIDEKENPGLIDRINQINENEDEVNIFDVKEKNEDENLSDKVPDDLTKQKEDPKTGDEWEQLLDEQEKKNRFEKDDDKEDIDRFKPKF